MDSPIRREEGLTRWGSVADFFREELTPYPGRWALVARMVISAVLCMIVIVTLRIPYGAPAVICAFVLSRENLLSTAKSGFYFLVAFGTWIVLMPIGARMFASVPVTHFLWEAVTAFLCFFFLKTFTYFPLATGLAVVATTTMGIWYLPGPAEQNVELTLWQIPSIGLGILITLAVESVFRYFTSRPSVVQGIVDRLQSIEDMLEGYGRGEPVSPDTIRSITQYAITGTSLLRQQATQDSSNGREGTRESILVALAGRGIDISAALVSGSQHSNPALRQRAELLRKQVSRIREAIQNGLAIVVRQPGVTERNAPLFSELEANIALIEGVMASGSSKAFESALMKQSSPPARFVVPDAFSNPDYVKFALAGTAASMLCYMLYVILKWPGISTAVTTCALTALNDTGSSRRKQLLRIVGASIGGFVFGVGSQIFILPYIDSIVGLTILFTCITGISAYVATASPRLSYAGLQMALAFYLINFTDFTIPLDLTIGRDRAVGVLLGVGAMRLVFERIYSRPAAEGMVSQFGKAVRLTAGLKPASARSTEAARIYALRDQFGSLLTSVDAEADAIFFERGERRKVDLAARSRIRRWQPTLKALFFLELPLAPFAPSGKGYQISSDEQQLHEALLGRVSKTLNDVANHLEMQLSQSRIERLGPRDRNAKAQKVTIDQPSASAFAEVPPEPIATLLRLSSELKDEVFKEPLFGD
jgi:multidrug resistance protein MdtO